jgi:N-acetylneuraminate synthase
MIDPRDFIQPQPDYTMTLRPVGMHPVTIGKGNRTFIIAEIGTDHNGDVDRAVSLIEAARKSGADCAKFQMVFADEIIHERAGAIDTQGRSIPIHTAFKSLERGLDFYATLKKETEDRGLFFLCSVFGPKSCSMLEHLRPYFIKVASPELNHLPLLHRISRMHTPVVLSTGLSTVCAIENALEQLPPQTALLHCVTSYPAPEEEYNLYSIPFLYTVFSRPVGISDHSLDPVLIPSRSVLVGASIIEKHICLKRGIRGLDDGYALSPGQFGKMVEVVRHTENEERTEGFERLANSYGHDRIRAILGTFEKKLSPSELSHYRTTKRSIRASVSMEAGTRLSGENCAVLRSTTDAMPGLAPEFLPAIIGKRIVRPVRSGEAITWEHLLSE